MEDYMNKWKEDLPIPLKAGKVDHKSSLNKPKFAELVSAVSGYFSNPVSVYALRSGLPLEDGWVQEGQLKELANRAGLRCEMHEKNLRGLSYLDLPALLVLKDDGAAVLRRIENDAAYLITESGGDISIDLAVLEDDYTGRCYTLQPSIEREITDNSDNTTGHWLWSLVFAQKHIYIEAATGSLAVNVLGLALPLFIMAVYDRIIPNFAMESLAVLGSGMVIVAILDFSLRYMRARTLDKAGRNIDTYLGNRVFNHLMFSRLLSGRSSGATANTMRELDVLREFLGGATLALIGDVPFLCLFILMTYFIAGPLVWVPLIILPLLIIFFLIIQYPLYLISKKAYMNASNRNSVLFEILNGLESVKASGAESWAAHRWEKAHAAGVETSFSSKFYATLNQNVMVFVQSISMLIIITAGVFLVRDGALSFGALFAAVILNGRIMGPVSQIAQLISRLHAVVISYREIDKIMTTPKDRNAVNAGGELPMLSGNLAFDKVDFSYSVEGSEESASVKVLDEISFNIRAGERVGIVGTMGAGKSTMLKLILNLIASNTGTIRIDGIDTRELDSASLRAQIGYMPQLPHFFSGTLKENVTLHNQETTDTQLNQALHLSGVGNWLSLCPLGLSQPVGERGDFLSGGQKQSIALSRALLGDPKLILLDEPTSLLDSQSEANFVRNMKASLAGQTLLVTTHRPAVLELVDRVIVLDRGRIVIDDEKELVLKSLAGEV
jgi:ATP-binding cassette subfamily C protein LapB